MSYNEGIFVKVFPKSENIIAKIGNIVLKERTWGIELAPDKDYSAKKLRISQSDLLSPHSISDFITIKEAIEETNFSYSKIRSLATNDTIDAIKIGRKWLILRDSLRRYIKSSRSNKK